MSADASAVYLWSTGEKTQSITVKSGGSYSVACGDGAGCAAISDPSTVNVNPLPKPVISATDNVLSSNYSNGNQWYLNGVLLQGAVQQNLTATESGQYSVKVSDANSCEGLSDSYVYTLPSTGLNTNKTIAVILFPNPNNGNFKIIHPSNTISVEICNLLGEIIYSSEHIDKDIDISFAAKGMYIVKVISLNHVHTERIIVE